MVLCCIIWYILAFMTKNLKKKKIKFYFQTHISLHNQRVSIVEKRATLLIQAKQRSVKKNFSTVFYESNFYLM